MTNNEATDKIDVACAELAEHFDAVQICVSWMEDGVTKMAYRGRGNWYARQGMCHAIISTDKAKDIAHELKEII